jgi:uncharacterized protein (DUF2147 family)
MKKLVIAAALLLAASAAQAGENYSFEIGGRTVRIHAPRGCDSPSCISISIPGVYDSGRKDFDDDDGDVRDAPQATAPAKVPAQVAAPAASSAAAPAPVVAAQPPAAVAAPAPVQQAAVSAAAPAPVATPAPSPVAQPSAAPAPIQQAPATATVAAATPAAQPVQPAPVAEPVGPLGMWMTEKKEGRVRIEECGTNLCGYSVDARTNENKEKVLINMKPAGSKWTGKIYDPKSGSTYSSTIAMKGKDGLRVQGCAFGGMFCGGQTWTRTN